MDESAPARTPALELLSAAELPELLANLAEAADFGAAGHWLLERFAAACGARCAVLLALDARQHHLETVVAVGVGDVNPRHATVPLDDVGHPLVVAVRGLDAVSGNSRALTELGIPFSTWTAVPLTQPQFRGGPLLRVDGERLFDERFTASELRIVSGADRVRRVGRAPFAVAVIEGRLEDGALTSLLNAAALAGPILARMFSVDELARSARHLDEQRNLLTAIIGVLPDPMVITDADNNVVVQNRRAEALLTPQDSDSEGRRRAIDINSRLFSSFLSKAVLAGGVKALARELNLVDPDEGTDLRFEVLAHSLLTQIAGDGAYVFVLRDVTDLKRASSELQRQYQRARLTEQDATRERDRLNLILNNVGDPILVTDDESKIILMNPQAEELFEPPEGAHDRRLAQLVQSNDTKFTALIADFAISPSTFRRERIALVLPTTGAELPVEVVAGKVVNERGEPLAIVSVLHDLTKQVENERLYAELKTLYAELEGRIRLATADLEQQNLRLQWQSSELEKAYRLKSEFLANMSHELRTPINALIGYASLMLDRIYGELNVKQAEALTRIQASSQHLLVLINDVLDLAKIEAGKMPVHLEPIVLRPVILEVAAQMEPLIRKKGLAFTFDVAADIPPMITDRTKMKQIVINLLSNAVKFTHRGSVSMYAERRGNEARISVRDSGIGIQPEHLEVIFEEFRQVDQSRTREYGGTGLGLSITRKLISLLGGRIEVESAYGKGSSFTVVLPLQSDSLTIDEQVARAAIGATVTGSHSAVK
ncbi:MAG: ATP-binding protein [Gemmatimonadaceae bacterium]